MPERECRKGKGKKTEKSTVQNTGKKAAKKWQSNKQLQVQRSQATDDNKSGENDDDDDDDIGNSYVPFSTLPVSPTPLNRSRESEAGDNANATASSSTTNTPADALAGEDDDDAAFNEALASFNLKRPAERQTKRKQRKKTSSKKPHVNSAEEPEPTQAFENAISKFSEQGDALADAIKSIQKDQQEQTKQFSQFMGMMGNFMQAIQTQFTTPGSNQNTD